MLESYIKYYQENDATCVGLSRIGGYGNRWSICWSSGKTTNASVIWSFIPDRFIGHNEKGIRLKWKKYENKV